MKCFTARVVIVRRAMVVRNWLWVGGDDDISDESKSPVVGRTGVLRTRPSSRA